ncbi:MAG TPA: CBS domain-containing protein [Actinomycetes bacterium]|nr:CBS domain-containing protein [Actinomycetes bacterium]
MPDEPCGGGAGPPGAAQPGKEPITTVNESVTEATPAERLPVSEVMSTDLMVVGADESVIMCWELMARAGVHHLPIVTDDGHFRGVVDAATIARHWDAGGPDRIRTPAWALVRNRAHPRVHPNVPISAAAAEMLEAHTDAVGVIDEQGVLVGLVTAVDLLAALAGRCRAETGRRRTVRSLYRMEPVVAGPDHIRP